MNITIKSKWLGRPSLRYWCRKRRQLLSQTVYIERVNRAQVHSVPIRVSLSHGQELFNDTYYWPIYHSITMVHRSLTWFNTMMKLQGRWGAILYALSCRILCIDFWSIIFTHNVHRKWVMPAKICQRGQIGPSYNQSRTW